MDLPPEENQPFDQTTGLPKASCGLQTEVTTSGWYTGEVIIKFLSNKDGAQEILEEDSSYEEGPEEHLMHMTKGGPMPIS